MSKEKSLRERREENERKRLSRQSTPNINQPGTTNGPTRQRKVEGSTGKLNTGGANIQRVPKSKEIPKVSNKKPTSISFFKKINLFVKEKTWVFIIFTVFTTLLTMVILYNFSTLLFKEQDVYVVPVILIPLYFLWFKLVQKNITNKVQLKTIITIICAVILILFTVGMVSTVTVGGKVYLSTSETSKVEKVTKSMWRDLEIIASAETLLLSTGAESRAFFPSMRDQSEELGKLSIKWAKIAQTESLPAPGLVEAASQIATSADWGSRALLRNAQSIAEPDPRADADVAEWTKLYQGNGSAAAETVVRVSELYGIKLGAANE